MANCIQNNSTNQANAIGMDKGKRIKRSVRNSRRKETTSMTKAQKENVIKMVRKEKEYSGVKWICLVLGKGQMSVVVKKMVKYRVS
jgi:hypothetical protein